MRLREFKIILVILVLALGIAGCGNQEKSVGKNETTGGTNISGSLGKQVGYKIIGIDPGTGLMDKTEQAIKDYDLGGQWKLMAGSEAAMLASLKKAIDNKEPIIVTGWKPHWKFTKYDLKFLDDPKKLYGEGNEVRTLVRKGLKQDRPSVYKFLDQFNWELSEEQEVMVKAVEGMEPAEAAKEWIKNHKERVNEWTKGVEKGHGEKVTLAYAAWADAIATTSVAGEILKELGYNVDQRQVEIGMMYAGIASGSADAMLASWMPAQQTYYDKYKDQFEDLGPNSKGTRIGLVVPAYMNINSIEDLKDK